MLYLTALMPVISIIGAAIADARASILLKHSTSHKATAQSRTGVFYLLSAGAQALFAFRETYSGAKTVGLVVITIGVLLLSNG